MRHLYRWALSWLIAMGAASAAAQSGSAIFTLLQQHKFAEAETASRAVLVTKPNDCSVLTLLGLAQRGQSKLDDAFQSFQSANQSCPTNLASLEGAAEIAYSRRMPEADGLLKRVIELQPGNSAAHAMLGAVEARSGDCEASVTNYAMASEQISRSVPALRQYAGCLVTLGRMREAVEPLTDLLALQDKGVNRRTLARAQSDSGDRAAAVMTLDPLLHAEPPDDAALLLRARISEADNKTPEAVAWLRQAIQVGAKNVENYLYFAEVSFAHGSYQVGVDLLNTGLQQLPDNPRLLLARGVLLAQLDQMGAALRDFEAAHRLDPKLSLAEDAMGVLFSQKHDMSAARSVFRDKLKAQPNDALLQYLYAESLSEGTVEDAKTLGEAIAAAKRSVELEPSYQPARDLLCVLLLRHGDLKEVVEQANEALKRDPYDEAALYQELQAERRLKQSDRLPDLVARLQAAKSHNQIAVTKYVLSDGAAAPNEH
ncbi:tetratricopeptide (TPR) repeat protein [Granulicella aggregans]|uniref:Tetratricopeptide (TPR) repeat protein n=1 Tax=Granulicella aggregans TaxID=474949 RepID=A0A7W7ZGC2_9BACT|nr:tetratricopeptide repeat protein [Granulicella aggregans]MBB5059218.1 tetratricopeptide (TPR) repeat protein [Granulicella aggregans]